MDIDMIEEDRNDVPYGLCIKCGEECCVLDMSEHMVCLSCEPDEDSDTSFGARAHKQ